MKKKLFSIENITLIGIFLGSILGIWMPGMMKDLKILGQIFLSLLKMIIVPLVFTSVFIAVLGLEDIRKLKDIGIKTLFYYIATTSLAVTTGLILVNTIEPGKGERIILNSHKVHIKRLNLQDILWSIIPSNPIKSLTEGKILQIIFFAIVFALAILTIRREKLEHIYNLFDAINDGLMNLTRWIIWLTPIGVLSLVGYMVANSGIRIFFSLWKYVLTVVFGLMIHAFLTLPALGLIFGRYNPYSYFLKIREAFFLAFSTASSAATLPVSMQVAEQRCGISKQTVGFVLPLGATINMDGTALYEAVAAVFIANVYGIALSLNQMLIIFITSTLASIGAAAIPGAGLIMLTIVLNSVGIPLEGLGLIITVDRFLDMLRTSVNVWGDLNGARIIDRFVSKSQLKNYV